MKRDISNSEDILDSRDVIARIDELEDSVSSAYDEYADAKIAAGGEPLTREAWLEIEGEEQSQIADDAAELKILLAFQEEAEGYAPDWQHGATLVRDTYWTEYVQELLEDCGDLPKGLPGYIVIDWDATASNIQVDYTSAEFDGVTYWVR